MNGNLWVQRTDMGRRKGILILNADDWARNRSSTERILECLRRGAVSSVSAMVFMEDSERGAALARERGIDVGLHLNLTTRFSAPRVPAPLTDHQQRIARYLERNKAARVLYHPGLRASFEYVVKAQREEFVRLYGAEPPRIDGHHHMHLCANVLFQKLLPAGTIVRRNFSFRPGEKDWFNSFYRGWQDRKLARRHRVTDFFFSLAPIELCTRLDEVLTLADSYVVEVGTHPANAEEYEFLASGAVFRWAGGRVARRYTLTAEEPEAAVFPRTPAAASVASLHSPDPHPGRMAAEEPKHICVCVCTYKRPGPLRRLLKELETQETAGLFTCSVVVADNDEARSAEVVVSQFATASPLVVRYCVEPRQNIALARNKAMENAEGDFVAWIDDDEFPAKDWLLTLFRTCREYQVDGVLGPVVRYFDQTPPEWLVRSCFYQRRINPTGTPVHWQEARTGNVLSKREIYDHSASPFQPQFRAGEDQDFFRRQIEAGRKFIWSANAVVYEVVPPARWRRSFMLRKALLRGSTAALQPSCDAVNIAKSVVAVPLYTLALPLAMLLGQHRFMTLLVKLCDHLGKLMALVGVNPIRDQYVTE